MAKPCSREDLHHLHHHTVVLLDSRKPLLQFLRDQEGEDYIELNVWTPRRCCSCGTSSDWISRIIHLLATRRVYLRGSTSQPLHRQNAFVQSSRARDLISPSLQPTSHRSDLVLGLFRLVCVGIFFVFYATTPSVVSEPRSIRRCWCD